MGTRRTGREQTKESFFLSLMFFLGWPLVSTSSLLCCIATFGLVFLFLLFFSTTLSSFTRKHLQDSGGLGRFSRGIDGDLERGGQETAACEFDARKKQEYTTVTRTSFAALLIALA